MKLVSIIIPMYNAEKYILHTLKLIAEQTYTNFETIIIDDCSTDNCVELCKKFIVDDHRFRLFQNKENKGICFTRNFGLSKANGDYIVFCDDDDDILPELLTENVKLMEKNNASLVKFGRKLVDINKNGEVIKIQESKIEKTLIFDNNDIINKYFQIKKTGVLINVWNGIYRNEIIKKNKLLFDTNMRFGSEDAKFSLEYLLASNKLVINPKNYYIHYRRFNTSTSKKFNINKIDSIVETARVESLFWNKTEDEVDIICAKNNYIIDIIVYQLLNDNCPFSNSEKSKVIKQVSNQKHLKYHLNFDLVKLLFQKSKKQFIFSILIKLKLYHIILILLSKLSNI